MPTPADQRLLDLLEKWLKSLDLHLRYASLDDDSYARVQPWVEHQRPTRWIIDLARQKTLSLKAQVEERVKMGDAKFSDALELMTFLANLVGSEHIERFIPLAEPQSERPLNPPLGADAATVAVPIAVTGTREMPQFLARPSPGQPPTLEASDQVARVERSPKAAAPKPALPKPAVPKAAAPDAAARKAGSPKAAAPKSAREPVSEAMRDQVLADAQRLLQWGRNWFELPELIARMADRPPLAEVRRILKDSKPLREGG